MTAIGHPKVNPQGEVTIWSRKFLDACDELMGIVFVAIQGTHV